MQYMDDITSEFSQKTERILISFRFIGSDIKILRLLLKYF